MITERPSAWTDSSSTERVRRPPPGSLSLSTETAQSGGCWARSSGLRIHSRVRKLCSVACLFTFAPWEVQRKAPWKGRVGPRVRFSVELSTDSSSASTSNNFPSCTLPSLDHYRRCEYLSSVELMAARAEKKCQEAFIQTDYSFSSADHLTRHQSPSFSYNFPFYYITWERHFSRLRLGLHTTHKGRKSSLSGSLKYGIKRGMVHF